VDSLTEGALCLHFAEEGEHADVAGANTGYGTEKEDHKQEGRDTKANKAKQAAAAVSAATVNYSAASWIENRHRLFSIRQHRF
jgi:hypothetical protein